MRKKGLRIGITRFPGSNCDLDTFRFFERFGHRPFFVWYTETKLPELDVLVLPGGFAFGDRSYARATARYTIDPGKLARRSPVMRAVRQAAQAGTPVLGICNGFQILAHAGLLPGKLERNVSGKFFCDHMACEVTGPSFFNDDSLCQRRFDIPVAHGYGRYIVKNKELEALEKNEQIFLRYVHNPNGSTASIAGVCNKQKTVFGMMPHPERSEHADLFMNAIESYVR